MLFSETNPWNDIIKLTDATATNYISRESQIWQSVLDMCLLYYMDGLKCLKVTTVLTN